MDDWMLAVISRCGLGVQQCRASLMSWRNGIRAVRSENGKKEQSKKHDANDWNAHEEERVGRRKFFLFFGRISYSFLRRSPNWRIPSCGTPFGCGKWSPHWWRTNVWNILTSAFVNGELLLWCISIKLQLILTRQVGGGGGWVIHDQRFRFIHPWLSPFGYFTSFTFAWVEIFSAKRFPWPKILFYGLTDNCLGAVRKEALNDVK